MTACRILFLAHVPLARVQKQSSLRLKPVSCRRFLLNLQNLSLGLDPTQQLLTRKRLPEEVLVLPDPPEREALQNHPDCCLSTKELVLQVPSWATLDFIPNQFC